MLVNWDPWSEWKRILFFGFVPHDGGDVAAIYVISSIN